MKITALAGGVGAARLLYGMAEVVRPEDLTIIVNTGDDFRWMGLTICPDLDTVMYTLSGQDDPATGWGLRDETFRCLDRIGALGGETWFRVGDRDLGTHLYRTNRLANGTLLSEVTAELCRKSGIRSDILPMTDQPVPTLVHTREGTLSFQDYFVRRQCTPQVQGFSFEGIEASLPAPGVEHAIASADAVVLCPSNPFISLGPILSVPGVRIALLETPATVLAVSPIVAGQTVKGPAADMMCQLGLEASATSVAGLYRDFLDIFVCDQRDRGLVDSISRLIPKVFATDTMMVDHDARISLARSVMEFLA
jgi:LPPG:FO 2-phospho-L-lactate transferase